MIVDRIAAQRQVAKYLKREFQDKEKAIALAKWKLKQESTEVALGEREEVPADTGTSFGSNSGGGAVRTPVTQSEGP